MPTARTERDCLAATHSCCYPPYWMTFKHRTLLLHQSLLSQDTQYESRYYIRCGCRAPRYCLGQASRMGPPFSRHLILSMCPLRSYSRSSCCYSESFLGLFFRLRGRCDHGLRQRPSQFYDSVSTMATPSKILSRAYNCTEH